MWSHDLISKFLCIRQAINRNKNGKEASQRRQALIGKASRKSAKNNLAYAKCYNKKVYKTEMRTQMQGLLHLAEEGAGYPAVVYSLCQIRRKSSTLRTVSVQLEVVNKNGQKNNNKTRIHSKYKNKALRREQRSFRRTEVYSRAIYFGQFTRHEDPAKAE